MALSLPGRAELREAGPLGSADVARTAWGTCQIRLVANRIASLRAGSTHKVYSDWRIEVVMDHGCPDLGTNLFTVPIDPSQLAASQTRYALVQLANQGEITVGAPAAFSWSTTSIGTSDPFTVGLEQARRHLETDGWMQDAMVAGCYAKPDPTQPNGAELDGWATEGGTCA